ncbi:MAG: histidine phosphatase family protein [Clostridia bacterium]|nr:histidine phosphatase family protein [Clostridia bacterium]
MITLIVVRHGQSEGNRLGLYCGQKDYPLSKLGFFQAQKTADYLKQHYSIDQIYSSDLLRAVQTAEPTAKAFGLPIQTDPALRERSVGVWEGLLVKQVSSQFKETYLAVTNGEDAVPEGGESNDQVKLRVNAFLERMLAESRGKCVAVFTHWGPLHRAVLSWVEARPEFRETFLVGEYCNASISIAEYDDDAVCQRVVAMGYNQHLEGEITSTGKHRF